MVDFSTAASVFKVGYGIGNLLFGKKKKSPTPAKNIMSQAQGVRAAAEKYNFNPLTLLQYGQPGGAMVGGGGPAPLASIDLITGGLTELDDWASGDRARRRQADQLEIDLAKLKLDQARSGVLAIGPSVSPLGRRAETIPSGGAIFTKPRATLAKSVAPRAQAAKPSFEEPNAIAPGREKDVVPLSNSPGVFEIQNTLTGGQPITIPGDSEPWGIDELATAVVVGAPQVFDNIVGGGKSIRERVKDKWTPHENSVVGRVRSWWNKK